MSEVFDVLIFLGLLAVGIPIALLVLCYLWPLLLCWWLGSPLLGVLCEVIWLVAIPHL
jgi:hypothetical protein